MTSFKIIEITNREYHGEHIITVNGSFENHEGLDAIKKVSSEFLFTLNLIPCDGTSFIPESLPIEKIYYPLDQTLII
jgi:hypothetical protein